MMRLLIATGILFMAATPAFAQATYFNSAECPTNADGSPVNPSHLMCDDFERAGVQGAFNWYEFNQDPFAGAGHVENAGWVSSIYTTIDSAGTSKCGAGNAAFGNCAAWGGTQKGNINGPCPPCDGAVNIAKHYFKRPGCGSSANPAQECLVPEMYARFYAKWDYTIFGNTKFFTITNDDGDIAFPSLYANNGGNGAGGTVNGALTIAVNYCNANVTQTACTVGGDCCSGAQFTTWNSQAFDLLTLLRNHWYFIEVHVVTDAKTGVFGSGRMRVWANDCGTVAPLPAGACGAAPILRRDIQAAVPGNRNGNQISNVHLDFWTGFGNQGNGPFVDNLIVSTTGPIGFTGTSSVAPNPPTAPKICRGASCTPQ